MPRLSNIETRDDDDALPNPKRGCGTLKAGKAYVIGAGFSPDGVLPSWVECKPHVPFREIGTEGEFTRSYRRIDGLTMQLALEDITEFVPHYPDELMGDDREEAHYGALENLVDHGVYDVHEGNRYFEDAPGEGGIEWGDFDDDQRRRFIDEGPIPESETDRHIDRIRYRGVEGGRHYGKIPACGQTDLLMRCGASYYPDPADYEQEAIRHGVSKAIPISPKRGPPEIVSGVTRCWIMHPKAREGFGGGIIGYAYLSEVAFTEPAEGDTPEYVEEAAETGKLAVREFEAPPEGDPDPGSPDADLMDFGGDVADAVETAHSEPVGYAPPESDIWHADRTCGAGEFTDDMFQTVTAARAADRRPCGNCCDGEWPDVEVPADA